jgi:uncharacterized protein (DUF2141 family)
LVFTSTVGWPERFSAALKAKSAPAQPGVTEVVIPALPPGDYAVVVLHDENENKRLDRGLFGIPKEQWACQITLPIRTRPRRSIGRVSGSPATSVCTFNCVSRIEIER